MEIVIIFKQDGTKQCRSEIKPVPLKEHAAQLEEVGVKKICASGNVPGPIVVPACCGCPTSQVNAFAISYEDWELLKNGIVGTLGFRLWTSTPFPDLDWEPDCVLHPEPVPQVAMMSLVHGPVLIRELLGRPGRCYRQGDALTQDYRPERVNIEMDAGNRITNIWFG